MLVDVASDKVQQVKALAAKPNDLSSVSRSRTLEEESRFPKLFSDLCTRVLSMYVDTYNK